MTLRYMTKLVLVACLGIALVACGTPASASAETSPLTEIKNTIDEIIKIVEKFPGKENSTASPTPTPTSSPTK